jgi:glyoxylase-like metal-dependent hydrolase (beta-lactamase superfamily II)
LAVADPHADHVADYLAMAETTGAHISYVFETHVQADHVSGARQLAQKTGAQIVMHETAPVSFPFTAVRDGDVISMGNVSVRILHTPGHAPEHISLLVGDATRGSEPWFILTGDTLFVGDVGRPDLGGAEAAPRLARDLYRSLFGKLLALDDAIEVYPSHFAGSACGRAMSGKPSSTIGFERRWNRSLRDRSEADFVAEVTADLPAEPTDLARIRRLNLGLEPEVADAR